MRRCILAAPAFALLILTNSCGSQSQAPAQSEADYRLTATVRDLMDSVIEPSAEFIWQSVETIVSAKGVEERMPRTDEEWREVRRRAITLLEATNLLLIPGRRVAKPGEKAEDPNVELAPEQIQDMIDKDRASWIQFAHALHEATMESFKAIEAKDAEQLLDVSSAIDEACENCHLKYWYPNDVRPDSLPSQKGTGDPKP
jgi:hypothetical protein